MQTHLFYIALVSFASGILLRSFFVFGLATSLFLLVLAGALAVMWRQYGRHIALFVSVGLLALTLGIVRMEVAKWSAVVPELEYKLGTKMTLAGVVAREPDIRTRTQHLFVTMDDFDTTVLVIADRYDAVNYGDVVQITGVLEKPQAFTTDLGRTFDYPGYLHAQGVSYIVRYPEQLMTTDTGVGNWFVTQLLNIKELFQTSVRQSIPSPHVGLAEGLLLGEKQALGDAWNELFRRTGIIHIVVLSGYNVMLVIGFFIFLLSWFCSLRTRVLGALIGVVCFALIVGLSATVVRASIMASLLLLATFLGRTYAILRALLLAGVIMLLINPYLLLYDPGFQLSFLATLGLIVVAPYFESLLVMTGRAVTIRDYVIATVATQIAVLPLLLYQVGELSLVSVLVNVLVLPMVPVAMLLTFVTGLAGLVSSGLATMFGLVTYWSLQYILLIVAFIGSWSLAAITVPVFHGVWVFVAYAGMSYWWYCRDTVAPNKTAISIMSHSSVDHMSTPDLTDWEIVVVSDKDGMTRQVMPSAPRNIFTP